MAQIKATVLKRSFENAKHQIFISFLEKKALLNDPIFYATNKSVLLD